MSTFFPLTSLLPSAFVTPSVSPVSFQYNEGRGGKKTSPPSPLLFPIIQRGSSFLFSSLLAASAAACLSVRSFVEGVDKIKEWGDKERESRRRAPSFVSGEEKGEKRKGEGRRREEVSWESRERFNISERVQLTKPEPTSRSLENLWPLRKAPFSSRNSFEGEKREGGGK